MESYYPMAQIFFASIAYVGASAQKPPSTTAFYRPELVEKVLPAFKAGLALHDDVF